MDIQNIKESFGIILELIKKGATIEAQQKIIELKEIVISLQEENFGLRTENLSLRQQLELSEKGERCPKCRKGAWNLVESNPHPIFGEAGVLERKYKCSECDFSENHIFDPSSNQS
jgi:regulator of replication initiation timing